MPVQEYCAITLHMFERIITAIAVAAALPFAAFAQAPEYQNPETVIHEVVAPQDDADHDPWGIADSDLPIDPEYRLGVLDNGMRFVIRPNGTPAGQGMVYLWINAGSLGEDEDQLGYAHFLEHMAFNGSTNVPEGEMIPLLEREGLAFGPDTNASTGFDRTIYQLNLPRNDVALLDTALMLMRETASNLLLEPEAVAREIGVIQSERRVRDTFQLRNQLDQFDFAYPGSGIATRWIGGTDETIDAATPERLRDYYERWYQPDNAAIIVVGDFDPEVAEDMVRQYFADWQGHTTEEVPDGGPVEIDLQGQTDIYLDPALPESITVSRLGPWIDRPDTIATRQQRVLRQIGYGIISRRLQRLQRVEDPPYRAAGFNTGDILEAGRETSLIVQAAEGEWQRGLAAAQEEYRRAMEFGFSASEVAEQVANLRAAIESNAAGAATRNNSDFITGALTLLGDGQVPTTPQTALERFNEHEPNITPETVLAALRDDVIPLDNPLIRFTGATAPEGGTEALRTAWDAGMATELAAREDVEVSTFAYSDFGPEGEIVSDSVEPLLGIREIRFANGVMLNLKQTDLEQDRISVQINVDGGQMLDTREAPLATAMTSSFISGGLGAHTLDDLVSALAGKQVGLGVSAQEETFRFSATTTPRDLEIQLQLFAAAISDPAYRPTGEEQYRRSVINWFAQRNATPENAVGFAEDEIISDNDPRFSIQPREDYMALTFAGLRDAISDRLDHGAIEVAIVGDFDEQQAIDFVARTLGALPAREEGFGDYADNRQRSFTADRSPRVVYHDGEPNQALIRMIWPTRDGEDFRESMKLEVLERIMRIKLTESLREELGQTYSPSVSASQSRTWPGWGTFTINASIAETDVDSAREAMLATVAELRGAPVDEDVLLRARAPHVEAYENLLKTNDGWMQLVDRAQTQADRLQRYAEGIELLQMITPEDVQAIAQLYLDPAQRVEITALPESE